MREAQKLKFPLTMDTALKAVDANKHHSDCSIHYDAAGDVMVFIHGRSDGQKYVFWGISDGPDTGMNYQYQTVDEFPPIGIAPPEPEFDLSELEKAAALIEELTHEPNRK